MDFVDAASEPCAIKAAVALFRLENQLSPRG
jgi:hypothetical protein